MIRLRIAGVAVVLAALYGGWILLRDAPLFAVQKVTITGLESAAGTASIRASLEGAAEAMTTTHFDVGRLRAAAAPFPLVKGLRAETQFPHGVRIAVTEERPIAALAVPGGSRLAVAADGRILTGSAAAAGMPVVPIAAIPTGTRIGDPLGVAALSLLSAAPRSLRVRVASVTTGANGLTVSFRGGPPVYFGDATRLHAKWSAVARVLADPASRGAAYLDAETPDRVAAQLGDRQTSGSAADAPGTAGGPLVTGAPATPEG